MKRLPEELRCNGYTYTLHMRGKRACIYAQHVAPGKRRWEVFLIKTRPAEDIIGKSYPEREVFPSNESFGKTAWTFIKLENAEKAFVSLEAKAFRVHAQSEEATKRE